MEKAYHNIDLKFEKDHLILRVEDQIIRLKISDVSDKLANASEAERKEYKISPSGYGINWQLIDEDLSINGLLQLNKQ
jgi:hypothetical protein